MNVRDRPFTWSCRGIQRHSYLEENLRMSSPLDQIDVVAIVRLDDYSSAVTMVEALVAGGITAVEFTYTNPDAGKAVTDVKAALGSKVQVGAGSVLDPETARAAILQGADFIVTPVLSIPTIELARRYSIPAVIGAFTPTEILTAWQAGATFVKVFPASAVGPGYLKDVRGPLPQVRLIPTGGVTLQNAGDFIRAGASAIAVGSNLVDAKTVKSGDWQTLTERGTAFIDAVKNARAS
jgi:2-dehydro-3-deoxyphosphogluconate aldolase/(4S)-4-hydroxy-2-oxoglutarate aldolase